MPISVKTLSDYFKDYEFTDDEIEISPCETILNIELFDQTHLTAIKNNSGNKTFKPYYDRLVKLYKLLNLEWDANEK